MPPLNEPLTCMYVHTLHVQLEHVDCIRKVESHAHVVEVYHKFLSGPMLAVRLNFSGFGNLTYFSRFN